jgi:hypothetical protein
MCDVTGLLIIRGCVGYCRGCHLDKNQEAEKKSQFYSVQHSQTVQNVPNNFFKIKRQKVWHARGHTLTQVGNLGRCTSNKPKEEKSRK